tara:strand:+ start:181 stop:714 length:534 start_codon:yes stop_codon:yes gene_type:complete
MKKKTPVVIRSSYIFDLVSDHFHKNIKVRTRQGQFPELRGLANYLCKKHTKDSLAKIGSNYGADHATVIHSIKMFNETYLPSEPYLQRSVNILNNIIDNWKTRETTLDTEILNRLLLDKEREAYLAKQEVTKIERKYKALQKKTPLKLNRVQKLLADIPEEKMERAEFRIKAMLTML